MGARGGGGGLLLSQAVFAHKHDPINRAGTENTHLHAKDFSFFFFKERKVSCLSGENSADRKSVV